MNSGLWDFKVHYLQLPGYTLTPGGKKKTRKRLRSTALALCLFGLSLAQGIKQSSLRREVDNEMTRKKILLSLKTSSDLNYFNNLLRGKSPTQLCVQSSPTALPSWAKKEKSWLSSLTPENCSFPIVSSFFWSPFPRFLIGSSEYTERRVCNI